MTSGKPRRRRRRGEEPPAPPNNNRKIALGGIITAIVIAIVVAVWVGNGGNEAPTTSSIPVVAENEGRLLGNPDASVAIRDFSDFRCPHCRDAASDLTPQIIENYINDESQVSFEFVPVAILGDESMLAAQASICAEDQGQFWAYHDKLFEQLSSDRFDMTTLQGYADDLGLDEQTFRDCMLGGKHRLTVEKNNDAFRQAGARGTPSFLIGTQLVGGAVSFSEIQKIIDAQLE